MPPRPKYRIFPGNGHVYHIGYLAGFTPTSVQYRPLLNEQGEPLSFTSNRAARKHIEALEERSKK